MISAINSHPVQVKEEQITQALNYNLVESTNVVTNTTIINNTWRNSIDYNSMFMHIKDGTI